MIESDKPTRRAQIYFDSATQVGNQVYGKKPFSDRDHAYMLQKMAEGLSEMAVGLRATYTLLKEVKELLQRQKS